MADIERLTQLRDHLAQLPPAQFDLNTWSRVDDTAVLAAPGFRQISAEDFQHNCGAVACIGGWANALFLPPHTNLAKVDEFATHALLGLTEEQGDQLFFPDTTDGSGYPDVGYEAVTLADAVTTLDKLIETGKVDWSHVQPQS